MDSFTLIAGLPTVTKDPNAVLDYTWDFTKWLPAGDTIVAAVPTPSAELTCTTVTIAGSKVAVWVSGGTAGVLSSVSLRITTAQGRVDDRTLYFDVQDR